MSDGATGWPELFALFEHVADAHADDRSRLLAELTADKPHLRARLEHLLRLDAASEVLTETVADWCDRWSGEFGDPQPERIGPWRVIRMLGAGGMGRVYLAERAEGGYEQRCALKLVRGELASQKALAHFVRERRILARLEHPGIATLIDGGVEENGRPWFAMRYVDGMPLTTYCHDHALNLEARLGLMIQICDAVAYAHEQFVLHCDLKPSNILVGHDGKPQLLDFGIARLLESRERAIHTTITVANALSPGYAAPEQVAGAALGVTTDVYALGAMLYEVLCGKRPYAGSDHSLAAVAVSQSKGEPRPPSVIASLDQDDAKLAPISARRLRGDLDAIATTALHHDHALRYRSVHALGWDLRRYLAGAPLQVRARSRAYRWRKFVWRHRIGLSLVALLIMALTFGVIGIGYEAGRARAEARTANAVKDFLVDTLSDSEPDRHPGRDISARELLDASAARLKQNGSGSSQIETELSAVLSRSYAALGADDQAEELARRALALSTDVRGPHSIETAHARMELAALLAQRKNAASPDIVGKVSEALVEVKQALVDIGDAASEDAVRGHLVLAHLATGAHRVEENEREAERADVLATQLDSNLWRGRASYAAALAAFAAGKTERAEFLMSAATEQLQHADNASGAERRKAQTMHATLLLHSNRAAQAGSELRDLLAEERRVLGPDHPAIADTLMMYAFALVNDNTRCIEATRTANDALLLSQHLNLSADALKSSIRQRFKIALSCGDLDTAQKMMAQMMAPFKSEQTDTSTAPTSMTASFFLLRSIRGEPGAADKSREFTVKMPQDSIFAQQDAIDIGAGYLASGDAKAALGWYMAVDHSTSEQACDPDGDGRIAIGIAAALLQLGRYAEVTARLDECAEAMNAHSPRQTGTIQMLRGLVSVRTGEPSAALTQLKTVVDQYGVHYGEDSLWTAEAHLAHAEALGRLGHRDDAEKESAPARAVLERMLDGHHVERSKARAFPSPV